MWLEQAVMPSSSLIGDVAQPVMKYYLALRELSSIYNMIVEQLDVRIQPPKMALPTLKSQPPTVLPPALAWWCTALLVRDVHNILVVQKLSVGAL